MCQHNLNILDSYNNNNKLYTNIQPNRYAKSEGYFENTAYLLKVSGSFIHALQDVAMNIHDPLFATFLVDYIHFVICKW